jgi:NADH dehydrogenase FAD-containing subunit
MPKNGDLQKITHSYDELEQSRTRLTKTSDQISQKVKAAPYTTCPFIIVGAGDTGTTVLSNLFKSAYR